MHIITYARIEVYLYCVYHIIFHKTHTHLHLLFLYEKKFICMYTSVRMSCRRIHVCLRGISIARIISTADGFPAIRNYIREKFNAYIITVHFYRYSYVRLMRINLADLRHMCIFVSPTVISRCILRRYSR